MKTPRFARFGLALAVAAGAMTLGLAAQAQDAQSLYVKSLAATCAHCHGTDGKVVAGSSVPLLAGLRKDYIVEQMKAFKAGTRPATIMHQLAKGYTDAQIEQMAAYFAAQSK